MWRNASKKHTQQLFHSIRQDFSFSADNSDFVASELAADRVDAEDKAIRQCNCYQNRKNFGIAGETDIDSRMDDVLYELHV